MSLQWKSAVPQLQRQALQTPSRNISSTCQEFRATWQVSNFKPSEMKLLPHFIVTIYMHVENIKACMRSLSLSQWNKRRLMFCSLCGSSQLALSPLKQCPFWHPDFEKACLPRESLKLDKRMRLNRSFCNLLKSSLSYGTKCHKTEYWLADVLPSLWADEGILYLILPIYDAIRI